MAAIFEYTHRVQPEDVDGVGHVNNVVYVRWLQDAAIAHSAAQGWPAKAYRELGRGWVVRSHFIEYLSPALPDDTVVVRTWVADMKRVTSRRRYEITRQGDPQLIARAETQWAFVNFSNHQPLRVPPEIVGAFEVVQDPAVS
jgi:acyl-CoA thioester hydrolase